MNGRIAGCLVLCCALLLGACGGGGARPPRRVITEDNVEVGQVKPLTGFALGRVWGYTGTIIPALPFGADARARLVFLEPFDPHRMPVIFVHGMTGTPRDFESLANGIDRSRFQPWVFHYQTGFRLGDTARQFARALSILRRDFGVRRVAVVAHSMGGLVTRQALNDWSADPGNTELTVPCFTTVASPLGGHPAAAKGAKAPGAVPAWRDLAPGTPFIEGLYMQHLPATTEYFLAVTSGTDGETDGVVPLANQRIDRARREASAFRNYPDSHVQVLHNPAFLADLRGFLQRCAGN